MNSSSEFAPAKINLTLEVLGKRPDGYHEIRSLIVFAADVGDRLTLKPGPFSGTHVSGEFTGQLGEQKNLVSKAVELVRAHLPDFDPGQISLEKSLPVASGLGGGSADAAAALRLFQRHHGVASRIDIAKLALALGADVPVCLASKPALVAGFGNVTTPAIIAQDISIVLANPQVTMPDDKTAKVFAALKAQPLDGEPGAFDAPSFASRENVLTYARSKGNALEKPARALFPAIDAVLLGLNNLSGARFVQMSGAGPTCYAIFDSGAAAREGAAALKAENPAWWIKPATIAASASNAPG